MPISVFLSNKSPLKIDHKSVQARSYNFLPTNNEHNEAIKPPLTSQLAVLSDVFPDLNGLCECLVNEGSGRLTARRTRGQADVYMEWGNSQNCRFYASVVI